MRNQLRLLRKTNPPPRKPVLALLPICVALLISSSASAAKLDLSLGSYTLKATASSKTASLSGLGSYRIGYQYPVLPNLALGAGYSLILQSVVSGVVSFGLDFGVDYYLISDVEPMRTFNDSITFEMTELWRPYVGLRFAQRQFEAIQSSYAGFGLRGGLERSITPRWGIKVEVRYLRLSGSKNSSSTELDFSAGGVFQF